MIAEQVEMAKTNMMDGALRVVVAAARLFERRLLNFVPIEFLLENAKMNSLLLLQHTGPREPSQ